MHKLNYENNTSYFSRVDWLIELRWFTLLAQSLMLAFTIYALSIDLYLLPLISCLLLLAVTNFLLMFLEHQGIRFVPAILASILVFDTLLLSALLYWTGGPYNPFSILYLAYVTLAAVVLGSRWTYFLAILSSVCFALLFPFHQTLPVDEHAHHHGEGLSLHLHGMLAAYIVVAFLVAYSLAKVTRLLKAREGELRDIERLNLNQEKLAALTSLSAGAAHELSSPLSTIAILAQELKMGTANETQEIAQTIREEVSRCREIIDRMSVKVGQLRGEAPTSCNLQQFISELLSSFKGQTRLKIEFENLVDPNLCLAIPQHGLKEALKALIRNALEASPDNSDIKLRFSLQDNALLISVSDYGSGMSADILPRAREPFFTTKKAHGGLGLGLFLVDLFAKRYSGSLIIGQNQPNGTIVSLSIPYNYVSTLKAANA